MYWILIKRLVQFSFLFVYFAWPMVNCLKRSFNSRHIFRFASSDFRQTASETVDARDGIPAAVRLAHLNALGRNFPSDERLLR